MYFGESYYKDHLVSGTYWYGSVGGQIIFFNLNECQITGSFLPQFVFFTNGNSTRAKTVCFIMPCQTIANTGGVK